MTTLQDEARRSAIAEYEVLDAPAADLEGLVWLAATLCEVPKAVINIIDDRLQHQVAAFGFAADVCSREDSMCAAVFERAEQVVVADSREDARFAHNPFVAGEIAHVRFYASSPLVTPDGIPIGTLCVFDDEVGELTPDRRQGLALLAEQVVEALELRRVARELRHSNQQLESFAGQIGHDLRNPLTAVAGFIELAATSPELDDAPDAKQSLARADAAAARMHAMISDLLDYARFGGAKPRREPLDLPGLVAAVLDDLGPAVAESGARVSSEVRVDAVGDPTLVRALLQNLVANAIKFTAASGAAPRIDIRASEIDGGCLLTVDDDGPGVPVDQRERVFELMERGRAGVPGLGIGLATCRRIVEAHGGRIGIDDSPLGGARVWATLPR
ncbi:sensor histidine kinase [Protaetiibacter mangrovi]|uniref:Sensor-like histidine kinase SenX3 n=1 Tax=Protaetiibacter mangrovi TaxID=2970926 RepID=A0ABT1ZCY6_9MICO|nr:GAF domain-containing sensor histidine kinase [Protaetiibacter mangrovi]MCS0498569.1 GAF domain-containing sensor histidine kinase [Protaetiibacter mangrovi]